MSRSEPAKPKRAKTEPESGTLKGWRQIAAFLGLPISAVQRWARSGMPVTRDGRRVQASPEELNRWLGKEAAEPAQIATETTHRSSRLNTRPTHVQEQCP